METKKSDQANLEKKRSLFFQIGLLLALGFAFVAFEWQVAPRISDIQWKPLTTGDIDIIDVMRTYPVDPPKPPPQSPQIGFDLDIVDDDVPVDAGNISIDWEGGDNIIFLLPPPVIVEEPEPDIFLVDMLEIPPLFNGKPVDIGFREYVVKNLNYPRIALENGVSGKVFVQFVVDHHGKVTDVQVARSHDPALDNEAMRLTQQTSGMWTPGKQHGKPVKVRFTIPITFQLQ